jgi:hypothetical protein
MVVKSGRPVVSHTERHLGQITRIRGAAFAVQYATTSAVPTWAHAGLPSHTASPWCIGILLAARAHGSWFLGSWMFGRMQVPRVARPFG